MRGGCAPSALPHGGASSPEPWVTFSPMRKSPKNLPEGRPLWVLPLRGTLRSPCGKPQPPRWGFCHRHRWSCHFEVVRAIGYAVSLGFNEEKYSAVNPWLGRGLVARLDATLGLNGGIGEGGVVQSTGVLCSLCRFCAASVQPTNRMITPFVDPSAQSTHYLL